MLLAIDVGNTNVTIGVFDGERLVHNWRLAALRERTADELGIFVTRLFEQTNVAAASVSGIAVASVVLAVPVAFISTVAVASVVAGAAGAGACGRWTDST